MLSPVEFPDFKGLDLRVDAQQASGAVDLQNVIFDVDGVVRTRDGLDGFVSTIGNPFEMVAWPGRSIVVYTTGVNVVVKDTGGSGAGGSTATADFVAQVVPTDEDTAYTITSFDVVKKLTSAGVYTAPAGLPTGTCIALQSPDSRLVVGNAGGNDGRVAFSDPAAPETFGANNYVTVPSQRTIYALVNWNDLLFAFTSEEFYVFYGNSATPDPATGTSIVDFNFRLVSGTVGIRSDGDHLNRLAVAATDGVYFVNDYGVFHTTGGPAKKVSGPLDPLFNEDRVPSYWQGGVPAFDRLRTDGRRLYLRSSASTGSWFMYDIQSGVWTFWVFADGSLLVPGQLFAPVGTDTERRLVVAGPGVDNLRVSDPTATSDDGTAIVSRYRSGFWNPGQPGTESVVREWLLDGTGTVNFQTAVNDAVTLGSAASVALGTSPAVAQGRDRRAVKGRNVSFQVGAASGAWSLSRVVANVAGSKGAGEKSS